VILNLAAAFTIFPQGLGNELPMSLHKNPAFFTTGQMRLEVLAFGRSQAEFR
jgi:hypothetical protein